MSSLHSASETAPLTTMASAMFFGTILFTTVALAVKSFILRDFRAIEAARNPRSSPLDLRSFVSIYTFLEHMSIFGLILFYAYFCEYHPPFPHSPKSYDRDEFFFMTALLFVVSAFTLKKNDPNEQQGPKAGSSPATHEQQQKQQQQQQQQQGVVAPVNDANEVLNRDQTEEWKGWMQFMFLLYHYYHAEETYNAIRVMITCYVWMTGFGNFSFFYLKGDYSSVRVMQMLWRLNFLVIFLCLTQGTTYILYYICLLHTYFFLMVYCTMRIGKGVNYTKMGLRIKLTVLALIIYVVWDLDSGIFRLVHWPFLGEKPMLGATSGAMWEWYFRSSLDHWSTFMGMVFALNFPITSLFFRKLEAQSLCRHVAAKSAMALVFAGAVFAWVTGPFMHDKYEYNATNAYFACVPLFAYVYFRNLTPWLRSHSLELLHQIGKTTLETYLMQHHIWLTSNAKSLLTLIPGWPMMNFLVVSLIYFFLSRRLYQLTLFLRGMVLPNDRNACILNLILLVGSIGAFVLLAFFLKLLGQLNLVTVAACSVGCGLLLYQAILSQTWPAFVDSSVTSVSGSTESKPLNSTGLFKKILSPTFGALVVVLFGIVWHQMSVLGASKIMPLPKTCESFVQKGGWIPVNGCGESPRGDAYRDYGASALGTCSPQSVIYAWGWEAAPSSSLCRFEPRDSKALLKTLNHRNVTFVGDSEIRHLYHAMCRQVGDENAGSYNTTMEKWSDFSRTYKNAALEFRWAPYTDLMIDTVKNISKESKRPDLVVLGGGAWDRLHRYNNETERQELESGVQSLAKEMKALRNSGVPVAWVVPTTINTWALMTDEKRANIREDQMAALRSMYKDKGIHESATFVLDGPSFTKDRVAESYDGVHYPLSVYDGGSQILANTLDWLLPGPPLTDPFTPARPGRMANPLLGLMVLGFAAIGIFLMDGFLGVSYLAGIFAPCVMPMNLYKEAFTSLHTRKKLPALVDGPSIWNGKSDENGGWLPPKSLKSKTSDYVRGEDSASEIESFLASTEETSSSEIELTDGVA